MRVSSGRVRARAQRHLGLPVALGDRQADGVEPAEQIGMDRRRAAGDDPSVVEAELAADRAARRPGRAAWHSTLCTMPDRRPGGRDGEVALGEAAARRRAARAMCSRMPSWNFSQTRGTAKRIVGRHACRSSARVAMLRANHVSAPPTICPKLLIERSVMWLSGRNDRKRSSGRISIKRREAAHRRHHVGVGDHRALRRAGRTARVDERGQIGRRHRPTSSSRTTGRCADAAARGTQSPRDG